MNQEFKSYDAISEAAAMWLARHDRGLTDEERREFEAWRNSNPRHEEEWASMSLTWESLNTTSAISDLAVEAAAIERRTRGANRQAMFRRWAQVGIAAAVVLTIGYFIGRRTHVENTAASEPAVALIAAEVKRVTLPDGSIVESRGDSDVKVEFSSGVRRIRLNKGEAFFTVAHDTSRPFVVVMEGVVVRAVGTAFNVRRDFGRVDVMVTEGSIRLEPSAEAVTNMVPVVSAGNGASVTFNSKALAVETRSLSPAELDTALAWRSPLLEFSRASLDEVLDAFQQHSPHHVRLGDPELRKRRISGTFQADNIEGFLRFGESMLGLKVERTANGEVILYFAP